MRAPVLGEQAALITDSRTPLLRIETAAASVDLKSLDPPVLGFRREAVGVLNHGSRLPPKSRTAELTPDRRRSSGPVQPTIASLPRFILTSRSTRLFRPNGSDIRPKISAPEHLAHWIGRSRRSGRFRSTSYMQCLGLRQHPVTELEIVICRPSRMHAAPGPASIRVCDGDHYNRSGRAGTVDLIGRVATAASVPVSGFVSDAAMLDVGPDAR